MKTAQLQPQDMTDSQLYQKCQRYGGNARMWMRKFEGLLPEVYERKLYKRRGFYSINHFAKVLAGMSEAKVEKILRISKKVADKPALKKAFENGEVSYSKIEDVAFVATKETDEEWAHRAKTMKRSQLQLEARKERESRDSRETLDLFENVEGFTTGGNSEPEECENERLMERGMWSNMSFQIDVETERKLRSLKQKLEKESGEALSFGEVLHALVGEKYEKLVEKAQRKRTINYCPDCVKKRADEAAERNEITRTVAMEIRHVVLVRQDYKCARDGCVYPSTELNHMDGYALTKCHDLERMEYLCKNHHDEFHAGDENVQKYRREAILQ